MLGVTRPSVHRMMEALKKQGLIRQSGSLLCLTQQGQSVLEQYQEEYDIFLLFFHSSLGFSLLESEDCAIGLLSALRPDCRRAFADFLGKLIVVNTDKLVLTGKKLDKKVYRSYTGYRGGLREISYKKLMAEKSDFAFEKAVERMMPKNKIGSQMLSKLYVYKGAEHKHAAQCPTALDL